MTQDEIIEMARKAGFLTNELKSYVISPYTSEDQNLYQELKAFAKLLAEKEREACAKLCETIGNTQANMNVAWRNGCRDAAIEIRVRGQE
jgi:hypothetical protein